MDTINLIVLIQWGIIITLLCAILYLMFRTPPGYSSSVAIPSGQMMSSIMNTFGSVKRPTFSRIRKGKREQTVSNEGHVHRPPIILVDNSTVLPNHGFVPISRDSYIRN